MFKLNCKNIIRISLTALLATAVFCACGEKKENQEPFPAITPTKKPIIVTMTMAPGYDSGNGASGTPTPEAMNSVKEEAGATATPTPTPTIIPVYTSKASMDKFLRTALKPAGTTLYVWGGGWNEADTGAGIEACTLGISNKWYEFFKGADKNYNSKAHDYEIHNGLDCSGYVGWALYNTLEEKNGEEGYVCKSKDMAAQLIEKGLGYEVPADAQLLAGDVVSMRDHVYIALGTCEDGSVLLLHSSPPGVHISGTRSKDGKETEAVRLAAEYTKTHFPLWYERYGEAGGYSVSISYTDSVKRFRWSNEVFADGDEFRRLSPEQVLQRLDELPTDAEPDILTADSDKRIYLNIGEGGEYAEATVQIEHMLSFKEDSAHVAVSGYEWLSFGVRIIIEDSAFEKGYNYQPFITNLKAINGDGSTDGNLISRISHIKSGVYEDEKGKKRICDTFHCEVLIPENSDNYALGFLDTAKISDAIPDFSGDNHLALFRLDTKETDRVNKGLSQELKKGDFVKTEDKGDNLALTWIVVDENDDEFTLLSLYLVARNDGEYCKIVEEQLAAGRPSEKDIIDCLWKKGLGYDTIVAAIPSIKCLGELAEYRENGLPEDTVFYDYALAESGKYCGADGIGDVTEGGGKLLELICYRPCIKIKKSEIH